jgi:hypothetical protein
VNESINIYTAYTILTYSYLFIVGIIIALVMRRKDLIYPFVFQTLSFFKNFIYADLCKPMFFFYFNSGKGGDLYLKMDSMQKFSPLNFIWIIPIILLFTTPIIYYKKFKEENKTACSVICPPYLKFKYYVVKEIFYLLLTFGFSIINFILSSTQYANEMSIGLFYLFLLLFTSLFITYLIKPYRVQIFNKILIISLLFPLMFVVVALLQIIYKKMDNHWKNLLVFINVFFICWLGVTALVLILTMVYFNKRNKKMNYKSKPEKEFLINDTIMINNTAEDFAKNKLNNFLYI